MNPPESPWRPVPGYEGIYEISSWGSVRSLNRELPRRDGTTAHLKGKPMFSHPGRSGTRYFELSRDGRTTKRDAQELWLIAWPEIERQL